jgi:hypothetical protein
MWSLVVVTPPARLVNFREARLWAPVFAGDEDMRVDALVAATQAVIEPPRSWLGIAFAEQALELRLDGFGCGPIALPYGPAREIVSVGYDDPDGQPQTLGGDVWRLLDAGAVSAKLGLQPSKSWPATACAAGSVRICYKTGHDRDDPYMLPAKHAITLGAVRLRALSSQDLALSRLEIPGVSTRQWTVSDAASELVRRAIDDLLTPYRVFSL